MSSKFVFVSVAWFLSEIVFIQRIFRFYSTPLEPRDISGGQFPCNLDDLQQDCHLASSWTQYILECGVKGRKRWEENPWWYDEATTLGWDLRMDQQTYYIIKVGNNIWLSCFFDFLNISISICRHKSRCSTILITVHECINSAKEAIFFIQAQTWPIKDGGKGYPTYWQQSL